jgi:hypothetical protein
MIFVHMKKLIKKLIDTTSEKKVAKKKREKK